MRSISWRCLFLGTALLLLSGCGSGPTSITIQPPSRLTYTTSAALYTAGTSIPANNPTCTGGPVSSYSVEPALPPGLGLNARTGVITGTPTAVSTTGTYTVTASNSAGSAMAFLSITVRDAAPQGLVYSNGTAVYTVGTPISPNVPASTGGAVSIYAVSPDLPAGLAMDDHTGVIIGTPMAAAAKDGYTITASNVTGSTTAALTITVNAAAGVQFIPNMNQWITPLAPQSAQFQPLVTPWLLNGSPWLAGQAVSSVVSGNTLLVLTSGFNRIFYADSPMAMAFATAPPLIELAPGQTPAPVGSPANSPSSEYVFVYDISTGTPVYKQVLMIPNTYNGIAFDPSQTAFYVSGGMGDFPFPSAASPQYDNVHVFTLGSNQTWAPAPSTLLPGPELLLGHSTGGIGLDVAPSEPTPVVNSQIYVQPCAAGVAVSSDGQKLVVANYYNDSITVFTGGLGNWAPLSSLMADEPRGLTNVGELDLRPGKAASSPVPGKPGGEYPFWVVIAQPSLPAGSTTTTWAYVSSVRDREIDVVKLDGGTPAVIDRIPVKGQPNKMTLNAAQTRLYVAEDESDTVDVVDTNPGDEGKWNTVLETIPVIVPPALVSTVPALQKNLTGANTNSVTLTPDGTQLWVTNGNMNSVAVVGLTGTDQGDQVLGLIPTGWYPNSVSFSSDGKWAYVINGKSPTGPDPTWCYVAGPAGYRSCMTANEWNPQLTKAGLQSFPTASLSSQLPALTAQVLVNNRFSTTESADDLAMMKAVRQDIHHVIFILKENRTYDQVLGDLPVGNGDPSLVQWDSTITPNQHNLAQTFVTLDDILATAEVSVDGWPWSTSARAPDVIERQFPLTYAARGLSLDSEGLNRNINVAIPTLAGRMAADPRTPDDPDVLAGQTDAAAPDGPDHEVNTGYLWDAALRAGLTVRNYGFLIDGTCYNEPTCAIPLLPDPAATGTVVANSTNVALSPFTDPYFRGFDNNFPDYYRYTEWARDFDANYAKGGFPSLTLVRFMHDHTGNFGTAIDRVDTPEKQEADNDYAVGLLVQKIAGSIYANETLIFVIEDDAQDGGDHVDSHRTIAFVAGAYVKREAVISTHYTTLDFLRTIEEVLGLPPLNLNDALARPMADVFAPLPRPWTFTATPSAYLYNTSLPLPPKTAGLKIPKSTHDAKYWARVTRGMDFSDADRVEPSTYNRILWKGMMAGRPYPAGPNGLDLRRNRKELLASYLRSSKHRMASPRIGTVVNR
ncbi:MAG TPA: putative Ig domain-containing protein [Terriglobia bacterium]|nr:putative Ig domain-containing protein [Terriglobia bacterium]